MTIQTFIFVHDENIILDFIKHKKFSNLSHLKFVFLGSRDTSKIENLENVIIARNYQDNIEDFPKLTSYTGWYLIWKNNLINSDYVNLFEYDVNVVENLESIILNRISENKTEIFGFIPHNIHEVSYLKHSPWSGYLVKSLSEKYKIDILDYISHLPSDKKCSMTSNHTMSKKSFDEYMEWVNPLIDYIKLSPLSGHEVERSISVFYLLKNKPHEILLDTLKHFQFDSHKTQNIGEQKFLNHYKNLF